MEQRVRPIENMCKCIINDYTITVTAKEINIWIKFRRVVFV